MSTPLPPPVEREAAPTWARPAPADAPLPLPPLLLSPPVRPYRSSRRLATVLRWLLLGCMLVAGADAAANAAAARLIDRLQADANLVGLAQIEASDDRTMVMAGVFAVVFLVAVGFLIAWTNRVYRNLEPLGVQGLRFTEGWAVGGWFVPFLNLVRPKQILDDVWRASGPDGGDDDWHRRKVTPLLHVWWGLWILGGLLSLSSADDADLSSAKSSAIAACVADGVLIIACAAGHRRHHAPDGEPRAPRHRERAQAVGGLGTRRLGRPCPRGRSFRFRLRRLRRRRQRIG